MDNQEKTDEELIEQYLSGSQESFEMLYQRYRKPLYSYLVRMLEGRYAIAEDIFQQTWIKVIEALPRYTKRSSFFSWLVTIARNSALDFLRKEVRNKEDDFDPNIDYETTYNPWNEQEYEEKSQLLLNALYILPPEQREVLLLRQKGVSFKEIARIQNCSLNTALGRMHYALERMRQYLYRKEDKPNE